MRSLALALVMAVSAGASADRLVQIPTGKKLPLNSVRPELLWTADRPSRLQGFLGVSLTESIDAELLTDKEGADPAVASLTLSYNFVVPVVDLTPGISFGVVDAFDRTEFGRGGFLALTWRLGLIGDLVQETPAEFTIGAVTNRGAFVGLMLPLAQQIRLVAEHDGLRPTAGLELRPTRGVNVRWLFRERSTLFGLSAQVRL